MKFRLGLAILGAVCVFGLSGDAVFSAEPPLRYANEVESVLTDLAPGQWLVKPEEEPRGDAADNDSGFDIKGVIAYYDRDYLRFDIMFWEPAFIDVRQYYGPEILFSMRIADLGRTTYISFRALSGEFIHIVKDLGDEASRELPLRGKECGGFLFNREQFPKLDGIYFILAKDTHFLGATRGRKYKAEVDFDCYDVVLVDRTIPVSVAFTY